MPRNRQKPKSQTYAGTGVSRPVSIKGEKQLDEAVAKATIEREQRVRVLEDENARLQIQLEQTREEAENKAAEAERAREEAERLKKELKCDDSSEDAEE